MDDESGVRDLLSSALAGRIRSAIESRPFEYARKEVPYTVSQGFALYASKNPLKKDEIIARADRAMFKAKHDGKNRVAVSSEGP